MLLLIVERRLNPDFIWSLSGSDYVLFTIAYFIFVNVPKVAIDHMNYAFRFQLKLLESCTVVMDSMIMQFILSILFYFLIF